LLVELEALKIFFENLDVLPQVEENIKRESLLKSSVYSARVEGNPTLLEKVEDADYLHKLEISNLLGAYKYIHSKNCPKNLSVALIKNFHSKIMKNISESTGSFRDEPWAIFNQAGVAVYLAPAHIKLNDLMDELILWEKKALVSTPVKSAQTQFIFEKIHPFADGNGRVGRLVSAHIMNQGGYDFRGLVSPEVAVDEEREGYYLALEPSLNSTNFTEFYLACFIKEAKKVLAKLSQKNEIRPYDLLAPRRREIFQIINDHPYASFDLISRRFLKVNPKTLHYDLKCLMKEGFIYKIGKTRGSTYIINKAK